MRRGTTPLVTLSSDDVTFDDYEEIVVTFKQGYKQVDVRSSEMTVSGNVLTFRLEQSDTLTFMTGKEKVLIQIKLKDEDDVVIASELGSFNMNKVLNEEVI